MNTKKYLKYKSKYLKYKSKYLNLKKKHGGSQNDSIIDYGTDSDESIDNTYKPEQSYSLRGVSNYDANSENDISYNTEDISRDQSDTSEIISNNNLAVVFVVICATIIGTSASISSIIP